MIIAYLLLLGLAFGSFINALVWRIYQQHLPKKKRAAPDNELSISKGRSMCPHCKHTLAWYDLLPVISWGILKGKCRYCKKAISWQYPLVELSTASLFVASYTFWPHELTGVFPWISLGLWLTALVGLMALLVYDLKWMLLPNKIVFPVTAVAVAYVIAQAFAGGNFWSTLAGAFWGLIVAGGIFYVLFQYSAGRWIGGGDVKLGFALGLLLGNPLLSFLMLFTASLLGIAAMLPALVLGKTNFKTQIPFGPFLIIATILVQLFGASVIDWYSAAFLYV